MASKASRRRVKFAESVGAVKKEYDNEVVDLRERAARLRERVRSNITSMKDVVDTLPKAQYNISDANADLIKYLDENNQNSNANDSPVIAQRTDLEQMQKSVLSNFDSSVQTMQSDILELLYEWDAMFDALEEKFKLYDKKRACYGHYGRKMQSLAAARKKRKDKGVAETVKNTQQWSRNKEKFKDARVAHDGHKAEFIKVSKSLLATQEPRSNLLLVALLKLQLSLFKGLVNDQGSLKDTMADLKSFIGAQRRELRTELDILEAVDKDTVDPEDMMMQMLLHLLKTFYREVKVSMSENDLRHQTQKLNDAPESYFQNLRQRFADNEDHLKAVEALVTAWNDLTAATIAAPSVSGQWLAGDKTKCLQGHHLGPFVTDTNNFSCNICGSSQPKAANMFSCRPCDFDVCKDCYTSTPRKRGISKWHTHSEGSSPDSSPETRDRNNGSNSNNSSSEDFFAGGTTMASAPTPAPAPSAADDFFGLFDDSAVGSAPAPAPALAPAPAPAPFGGIDGALFGSFDTGPAQLAPAAANARPERRKGPYIWDYTHSLWRHRANGTYYNEQTKMYTRNPGPSAVWLRLVNGKLVPVQARQSAQPRPAQPRPAQPRQPDAFAGLDFSAPEPVAAPAAPRKPVPAAPPPVLISSPRRAAVPAPVPVSAPAPAPAPAAPAPVLLPASVPAPVPAPVPVAAKSTSDSDEEPPPPLPSRPSRRRAPKPPPGGGPEPGKLDPSRGQEIKIIEYLGKKQ